MMKMNRPLKPEWLRQNFKKWGRKYKENKELNKEYKPEYKKKRVNILLLPILRTATKKHCAFCDDKITKGTIEHFRPKSEFPLYSYVWRNLFPSCNICQEKNNRFSKYLLKPDRKSYSFNKYFLYNSASGEIEVNPKAIDEDKIKAEVTIEIYKLNSPEQIESRMDCFENYSNKGIERDKLPYRFIFIK